MSSFSLHDMDRGWERLEKDLRALAKAEVKVGLQGDEDSELVRIGTIHEFGSKEWKITSKQAYFMARRLMQIDPQEEPARFWGTFRALKGKTMKIPERSFIRAGFDTHRDALQEAMRRTYDKVMLGDASADEALSKFGEFAQLVIQRTMRELDSPPNAPLTRFVKQSENPLIDTGRLHGAIRYVIKLRALNRRG